MSSTGGGSATNAGIDYQQRVAAIFLISLYSKFDIAEILAINDTLVITNVSYETSESIDDLNANCDAGKRLLLQIKRKISLSILENSDFRKVIMQFTTQYLNDNKSLNRYILVTTSDASRSIKYDLKKILDSIRLNDTSFNNNPLNESEKKTYDIFKENFNNCYTIIQGKNPDQTDFVNFCRNVFVTVLDVEEGMTTEKIAIMLLHTNGFIFPSLVWKYLVAQSLYYASNRLSINSTGVKDLLKRYLRENSNDQDVELLLSELLKPITLNEKQLSTGKEVLLIESFKEKCDLLILELARFDSQGRKIVVFKNDSLVIGPNDKKAKVIRRFATCMGLQRYIEENKQLFADKTVGIIESVLPDDIEESDAAIEYKKFSAKLLSNNKQLINCLHSKKSCFSSTCYLVEVDYPNFPESIGLVLEEHLNPLDRILGKPILPVENDYIPSEINIAEWLKLVNKGQGLIKSLPSLTKNVEKQPIFMLWNEDNQNYAEYRYCIRKLLDDGSNAYVYARGKIQRFPKYEAIEAAKELNNYISKSNNSDDPWCITSKSWSVGPKSRLMTILEEGEEILGLVSAEAVSYSNLLGELYNRFTDYYAPLCLVIDKETERISVLSGTVPLISDPFQFKEIKSNWTAAGFEVEQCTLLLIKSDYEFDKHMRDFIKDGLTPIIDPKFDNNQVLGEGVVIRDIDEELNKKGTTKRSTRTR
ncbi:MAG: hypothetical protein AB1461_15035 [Thermodesulfobacteriota bacterium]